MSELEQFFSKNVEDSFIEKSQILGARMIVGSTQFENERIIRRFIFNQNNCFIQKMVTEIKSRHAYYKPSDLFFNIKEDPGGLSDIRNDLI